MNKITLEDKNYPLLLKEIPGSPKEIYYLGRLPKAEETLIAIVGTRKATSDGRILAKQIAKDLAEAGITIVSGLAFGIDAAAHEGALAGGGKTIAVLATGLDTIYPRSHERLVQEILKNDGALISEYPPGTPAYPNQFLERNRIISGLCIATVIIEAPIHSGALVTARHALEQGREIFVTPGPARHQNYKGSHLLIRNGARLITSVEDILEDLNLTHLQKKSVNEEDFQDPQSKAIIAALKNSKNPLTLDNIIGETKLEPHIVYQRLTFLTLEKIIEERNGKFKFIS